MANIYYKTRKKDLNEIKTFIDNASICDGVCLPVTLKGRRLVLFNEILLNDLLRHTDLNRNLFLAFDKFTRKDNGETLELLKEDIESLVRSNYHVILNDNYDFTGPRYLVRHKLGEIKERVPGLEIAVTNRAKVNTSKKFETDYLVDIHRDKDIILAELESNRRVFIDEANITRTDLEDILTSDIDSRRNNEEAMLQQEGYSKEYILLYKETIGGYNSKQLNIITSNPKLYIKQKKD